MGGAGALATIAGYIRVRLFSGPQLRPTKVRFWGRSGHMFKDGQIGGFAPISDINRWIEEA
jgi:hypothetical protein